MEHYYFKNGFSITPVYEYGQTFLEIKTSILPLWWVVRPIIILQLIEFFQNKKNKISFYMNWRNFVISSEIEDTRDNVLILFTKENDKIFVNEICTDTFTNSYNIENKINQDIDSIIRELQKL